MFEILSESNVRPDCTVSGALIDILEAGWCGLDRLTYGQSYQFLIGIRFDDDIFDDRSYGIVGPPRNVGGSNAPSFTRRGNRRVWHIARYSRAAKVRKSLQRTRLGSATAVIRAPVKIATRLSLRTPIYMYRYVTLSRVRTERRAYVVIGWRVFR